MLHYTYIVNCDHNNKTDDCSATTSARDVPQVDAVKFFQQTGWRLLGIKWFCPLHAPLLDFEDSGYDCGNCGRQLTTPEVVGVGPTCKGCGKYHVVRRNAGHVV